MPCLIKMERSTAEPKYSVTIILVLICRRREANFQKSSLAEVDCDARVFAGDREGCCVGGTWCNGVVLGDRVEPGSRRLWKSIV